MASGKVRRQIFSLSSNHAVGAPTSFKASTFVLNALLAHQASTSILRSYGSTVTGTPPRYPGRGMSEQFPTSHNVLTSQR